jgi:beta-lactamase class D
MKTRSWMLISLSLIFLGCAGPAKESPVVKTEPNYFEGMDGCFLLYNMKTGQFEKTVGGDRCRQQLPACSTFKVPLAVMAFDSGALKDENQVLKWDGKKDVRAESNQDHNAKTWMRDSIVWFSQRITPKLGKAKFQKYLDQFDYGNKDISAGIKEAWLVSPSSTGPALKVSAFEQADFLKKLWSNQLPASERSMKLAREITFLETSPNGFQMNGKTGSNYYDNEKKVRLGWFISHIQKGEQEYLSVVNFSDLAPTDGKGYGGPKAKEITKKFLADQGLW